MGSSVPGGVDQTPTTREVPSCTPTGERTTKWPMKARGHHSSLPTLGPVQYDTGGTVDYSTVPAIRNSQFEAQPGFRPVSCLLL